MKRLNYIFMLLVATVALLTGCNKDDKEVIITADFDPDFAKVLQEKGYISDATHITLEEIRHIQGLNVSGTYDSGKGLTSLKGIEYFESLTDLFCYSNQLSSLDVSKNTKLTVLDCYNNQLTTLDISNCTELTVLDCFNNQLTSLDVGNCTELTRLECEDNQLTSLDVSNSTKLTYLECQNNRLTTLDIRNNTKLTYLYCYNNPGNGKTLPVIVWKGYESVFEYINIEYWGNYTDYTSWKYDGQTITTDFQVVE